LLRLPSGGDLSDSELGRDHQRSVDLIGMPALEALTFTLIFNTAPVAFGALGTPITVLGQVTDLPAVKLGAMVGRQLPSSPPSCRST